MITNVIKIRPRYNEVDQMGYVYHANYVSYCHQARTELMRKYGVCDAEVEAKGVMMPVVSFNIKYKKPVGYDEELTIKTSMVNNPKLKMGFYFELYNNERILVSEAHSEIVFVDLKTRKPLRIPSWITEALYFNKSALVL